MRNTYYSKHSFLVHYQFFWLLSSILVLEELAPFLLAEESDLDVSKSDFYFSGEKAEFATY